MTEKKILPIGMSSFEAIREENELLYVDKTAQLVKLTGRARRCFLSRPRRFGKSLTISTLEAMFKGKTELFKGLAAESWVAEQAKRPTPVLRFDMSALSKNTSEQLKQSLNTRLTDLASQNGVALQYELSEDRFRELLNKVYDKYGPVAVLIDEYDAPIIEHIDVPEKANEMREALRSFYTVLKANDGCLRFLMLTGVSKFSKMGLFSAMNNLNDISGDEKWGTLVGITQEELERDFAPWIEDLAAHEKISRDETVQKLKDFYDGYSFDGTSHVYNPWSLQMCFEKQSFDNYWYRSATPSSLVKYLNKYGIDDPTVYGGMEVDRDFADVAEIENASPESFLYQTGYLTIAKRESDSFILDYPNKEVKNALSKTYVRDIYGVKNFRSVGDKIWSAFRNGDIKEAAELFNQTLVSVPYETLGKAGAAEALYQAIFITLLTSSGVVGNGEVPNGLGRSDVVVYLPNRVYVFEFKLGHNEKEAQKKLAEGMNQIELKKYAEPYLDKGLSVTAVAVAIDGEKRQALPWLAKEVNFRGSKKA